MRRASILALLALVACSSQPRTEISLPPLPESFVPQRPVAPDGIPSLTGCRLLVGDGEGAEVVGFVEDAKAPEGLREGDVISAVDDAPVRRASDLAVVARERQVGDSLRLTVERQGAETSVTVTLQESPFEAGRPMIGVLVGTVFRPLDPEDAEAPSAEGPFVRVLHLDENGLYLLDPERERWGRLSEEEPTGTWATLAGQVYDLDPGGGEIEALLDGERIPLPTAQWEVVRLAGAMEGELLLTASRNGDAAVVAVDPSSGRPAWSWIPTPESAAPNQPTVQAPTMRVTINPARDRALVAFLLGEDASFVSYGLLDREGRELSGWGNESQRLHGPSAVVHGWFDDRRVLFSYLSTEFGPPGLSIYDLDDGSTTELTIQADLTGVVRLIPAGDGRRLLADGTQGLLLIDSQGELETRLLAEGCRVGVTDPGWTP